jgi:hypothetical protein
MAQTHDAAVSVCAEICSSLQGLALEDPQLIITGEIVTKIVPIIASSLRQPGPPTGFSMSKLDEDSIRNIITKTCPKAAVNPENLKMLLAFLMELLPMLLPMLFPKAKV